jgi:thymidylate synthase (FAD)
MEEKQEQEQQQQRQQTQNKIMIGNAGFVELLETFGSDLTVVNAARVSFHKESNEMTSRDSGLINYLATHNHNSPFFHPQLRFRIKMPIFIAREWFRHTVGFSRNEVSRRYVDEAPEVYIPTEFRKRDTNAKQGSKDEIVEMNTHVCKIYNDAMDLLLNTYTTMLEAEVAPEMARAILPQSMYTEFIETGSLAAYARLCGLRMDSHAQKEIQEFAKALDQLIEPKFPVSWKALNQTTKTNAS